MAVDGEPASRSQSHMPMAANMVAAAGKNTVFIIFSMPGDKRAEILNATALHLQNKGFHNVLCCANPPGTALNCTPTMFSTRGIQVALGALFDAVFGGRVPEEWLYIFVGADSVRLGPEENFDTCVRWLNQEGMHVMGYGEWKKTDWSWWGGTLVGFTRNAFLKMVTGLRETPPAAQYIDIWWKKIGAEWNSPKNHGPKCFIHPERAGPHARMSTTLVAPTRTEVGELERDPVFRYGGSLCPDGKDCTGARVLLDTGPVALLQWMQTHQKKLGRELRRDIIMSPNERIDIPTAAGPPEPGLWTWNPGAGEYIVVGYQESEYLQWTKAPWSLNTMLHTPEEQGNPAAFGRGRLKKVIQECCQGDVEKANGDDTSLLRTLCLAVASAKPSGQSRKRPRQSPPDANQRMDTSLQALEAAFRAGIDEILSKRPPKYVDSLVKTSWEERPEVFLGAFQCLGPPEWDKWKASYPERIPQHISMWDARFGTISVEKSGTRRLELIRCDCQGCIDDEMELEDLRLNALTFLEAGQYHELARLLLDQCCTVRRSLFGDEEDLLFKKEDGNWHSEARWCGPGSLKKLAWEKGLIDAHWKCHPCLAKMQGFHDASAIQSDWVARQNVLGEAAKMKEWRRRCGAKLEQKGEKELQSAHSPSSVSKAKSKISAGKAKQIQANKMSDEITLDTDHAQRIKQLAASLKKQHEAMQGDDDGK